MTCFSNNGRLNKAARLILAAMEKPEAPEDIAAITGFPLHLVQNDLEEMAQAGLVDAHGKSFVLSPRGREALEIVTT